MNVTELQTDMPIATFASAKLNALTTQRGLRVVEQGDNPHFPIKDNFFASFRSASDQGPQYAVWWFAFLKPNSVVEVTLSGPIDDAGLDGIFKTMIASISLEEE